MPIYAYRCESCGHAKDVLQKISDAPLTDCPSCGAAAFKKQLTAAGFQLKGSGWYATDFKGGSGGASGAATGAVAGATETAAATAEPAASASTPCGASCACH
jgi:putative FmdB family regulatory protein